MRKPLFCLDIKQQHANLKKEIFALFEEVYDNVDFSNSHFVTTFECKFARYCGTQHAIGVNSGSSALHLGLLSLGIGAGDEVIVPANTFIATAFAVSYTGAVPVFVDCDVDTWQIDNTKIEEKITAKTKAVIGVHLYGQPFDIAAVSAICKKHNLYLIEDAAQAHGALYNGQKVGSFGDVACFSFYPAKNIGACGEAGGITTNKTEYAEHIKQLRNYGSIDKYHHNTIGFNYRMGGLEAASLLVKMKYIDEWNQRRKEIGAIYLKKINNPKIKLQIHPQNTDSVFHLFVITTSHRDEFVAHLKKNNIHPAFHYPAPCHLQNAYKHLGYKHNDFPYAEYLSHSCVSLPFYPELNTSDVDYIIEAVNSF